MNVRDEIIIEYGNQPEGWAKSGQLCPACQGGRSKEHSLRVSVNNGRLSWRCYRDSCKFNGWWPVGNRHGAALQENETYTPVVFTKPLDEQWLKFLSEKYHIEEGMLQWAKWELVPNYKNGGPRVRMPIIGPDNLTRADTWRSYQDGVMPKAIITKRFKDEITMCWYRDHRYGKTLVVVEDQPSALRLRAAHVDSLALCGTLISPDRVEEIKAQKYERVVLCLDNDATASAIKAVAMYRNKLKGFMILPLEEDVKDMSQEDFELLIDEVTLP